MAGYRIFFLDREGAIAARQEFEAASDEEAMRICTAIAEVCSDMHYGCKLWRGAHYLFATAGARHYPAPAEVSLARQTHILEIEEAIQCSHWHVAKSQKLLAAIARLRDEVRSATPLP